MFPNLPSSLQAERNFLSAISDVISNQKKQHDEEMKQMQQHHDEVVAELKQQAIEAQQNYREALAKASEQIKWSRWAFYMALVTLLITTVLNIIKT